MMKLAELIGRDLKWVRPNALKAEYELYAGEMVAATLQIRGLLNLSATAESADGRWTFRRHGFWRHIVIIRESGVEQDMGIFRSNNYWSVVGKLELPDGRQYPYEYAFKLETGEALISYRTTARLFWLESQVEIHPLAKDVPEMPWMVPLGWYLKILENKHSYDYP